MVSQTPCLQASLRPHLPSRKFSFSQSTTSNAPFKGLIEATEKLVEDGAWEREPAERLYEAVL